MGRIFAIVLIAVIVISAIVWLLGIDTTPLSPNPTENPQPSKVATTTPEEVAQLTYRNASDNLIRVVSPQPGDAVPGTFTLTGEARGNWYFEASFPIEIVDANGARILQMPIQAQGEWMTTEFVPFSTEVVVPNYRGPATLILHKDNASGLPEHDASVSMPIVIR